MRLLRSLVLLLVAAPLLAQQTRVTRDAGVHAVPDGTVIATVTTGSTWRTGVARSGFTLVTIEGWIDAARVGARRDSFPASVSGTGTLRIRADASANARILGVFQAGAGIRVLERKGGWSRVRRDGWVLTSALAAATAARPATPAARPEQTARPDSRPATPAAAPAEASVEPVRDGALRATGTLPLRNAPGTSPYGLLDSGTVVDPVVRDRGWVKIRVETWVPESLLVPADSSYIASLTAADLRLDPETMRGRTVRWRVQFVSLQTADPLRRALQPDEPYILAMGPSGENAILYLAVPANLLAEVKRLTPLSEINVTARVRNGRSQPTGAPVLDLLSLSKR